MSGIKNLFHEYNQQLMEFGMPPQQPVNPMMGYGGIPSYQMNPMMMQQKPIKFPSFEKKKDNDDDGFWKALLAAGAVAGIGGLGIYGYNKYQQHNSPLSKLGRAGGDVASNLLQQFGPDLAGAAIQHGPDLIRQHAYANTFSDIVDQFAGKNKKSKSKPKTKNQKQNPQNQPQP